MKKFSIILIAAALVMPLAGALAQNNQSYVHEYSQEEDYTIPDDPSVLQKLSDWQDLKFGVMFHWGLYSIPGMLESWCICSEDSEPWEHGERIRRGMSYDEFKSWYWGLNRSMNPVLFNPDAWASTMKDAGAKYMILTTKHHDGFCMFDTKYTDFKITNTPFGSNPKADVFKYTVEAFRSQGFWIGAYFSKPDWHCPWFWNPVYATADRYQNYDRERHPDWWQNYVEYTQNQLNELTTNYGPIDILWLDGGWINGHDINLGSILPGIRERHPGLICVDRACRNEFENYQTPECTIPPTQRNIPWETCDPLAGWGWTNNPSYKSARTVIANLTEVVAKGGNYLLGVGPTPAGTIDEGAQAILGEIGQWLRKNGEAIYGTVITPLYNDGNVWFTAAKDGRTIYAVYALKDGETLPEAIEWTGGNVPSGKVTLLGSGKSLKVKVSGDKVSITLPKNAARESVALKFTVK